MTAILGLGVSVVYTLASIGKRCRHPMISTNVCCWVELKDCRGLFYLVLTTGGPTGGWRLIVTKQRSDVFCYNQSASVALAAVGRRRHVVLLTIVLFRRRRSRRLFSHLVDLIRRGHHRSDGRFRTIQRTRLVSLVVWLTDCLCRRRLPLRHWCQRSQMTSRDCSSWNTMAVVSRLPRNLIGLWRQHIACGCEKLHARE